MAEDKPSPEELLAQVRANMPSREERQREAAARRARALEEPVFREVYDVLEHALERYELLERQSEAAVVTWRSSNWTHLDLDPYHSERNRFPRPIVEEGRLAPQAGMHHLGYDAAGRLRIEQEYPNAWGKPVDDWSGWVSNAFVEHGEGTATVVAFDNDHPNNPREAQYVARYWIDEAGRVTRLVHVARHGFREERFAYDGERVVECHVRYLSFDSLQWPEPEARSTVRFEHDAGALARIVQVYEDGRERELYLRPTATVDEMCAELTERLLDLVPRIVRTCVEQKELTAEDPIDAVALSHGETGNGALPPYVGIRTRSRGAALVAGADDAYTAWNPAEFELFDPPARWLGAEDPAFERLCRVLEQQLTLENEPDRVRALLIDVAARLNQRDAGRLAGLPLAPHVVVYPTDFQEDHLRENLELCVPRARLRAIGMAPSFWGRIRGVLTGTRGGS